MASADQISCRNLGRQSWASAPTGRRRSLSKHPGQRRTAERLRRGRKGWVGIAAEIIPKGGSNLGQSLSRPPGASSLYTREPLGTGDADRRVGPAGLLAMAMVFCHSEASVHTGRGNPSFLRWTGVRAAVPRAWPPPAKFRNEIWGVGQVVGPYGRSTEVPATGRCGHRPLRVVAESCRDHPGSALSAERGAGQIRFLPDVLFVQHGVQGSEVCGRLRPCSRWYYLN